MGVTAALDSTTDGPEVPVSLLGLEDVEGYEALDRAIERLDGAVAVTAPPYAGRRAVLDSLADRLGTEVVDLAPDRAVPPEVPTHPGEVLVVDGCHHLYDRRVGGFDALRSFLESVARTDALVLAGWTSGAWAYLDAARDLGGFDTRFPVPGLDREAMETFVLERHEGSVTFEAESTDHTRPVRFDRTTVTLAGRELAVPVPRYDPDYRSARRAERFEDPATAAFARLTDVSDGNPGVAWAIWLATVGDERVNVGEVRPPVDPVDDDTGRDAAFLLRVVACAGRLPRERLRAVVGEPTDRLVRRFEREGYLVTDDERVAVAPAALPRLTAFCDRRRVP